MNSAKVKKLAKQGNPQAIAILLNHSLQRQGIQAKVGRENNCLQIMLESEQVPASDFVRVIRQGLIKLEIESIEQLKIYGKQIGEDIPDWSQEVELATPSSSTSTATDANIPPTLTQDETQDLTAGLISTQKIKKPKSSQPKDSPNLTEVKRESTQEDFSSATQPAIKPTTQSKRFLNHILDIIIYLIFCMILGIVVIFVWAIFDPTMLETEQNAATPQQESIEQLIAYCILFVYYLVSEAIWSKTPAKFITKTKVVNNQGEKPSLHMILRRTIIRFIPFEAFSLLGSKHPRGWHDKWSNTKVVDD
ncbi:MAG: RDD family protein [Symploca sp. SIO3E6]|nr:RDD family protein [Caldora sp. SIO3E6]